MRYIITHGHIFKNAGTTLDSALKNAFGNDFLDHRDDKSMRQGGAAYLKQLILEQPNLKALSSHHLCNPLPVAGEFSCIPIYFLRNPIERVVSVYNFERKQGRGTVGAEVASRSSLAEYVRWRMQPDVPKTIFNYQTAYLGAERNMYPHEAVTPAIFNNALRRLEEERVLVGTVENFDESFALITRKLASYFPNSNFVFKVKNVTNAATYREKYQGALDLLKPVLPELIAGNAFDIALHNLATERLNRHSSLG